MAENSDRFLARLFWLTVAVATLMLLWRMLPQIESWFAPVTFQPSSWPDINRPEACRCSTRATALSWATVPPDAGVLTEQHGMPST